MYTLNFRGKNQLDFFVEFVKGLKMLNKAGGYFSTKYNNIHINITSNRLSELSQYGKYYIVNYTIKDGLICNDTNMLRGVFGKS